MASLEKIRRTAKRKRRNQDKQEQEDCNSEALKQLEAHGERFMAMFYQSDSDADAVMEGDDEAPMQAEHPTRPVSQIAVTDCAARHKKKPSKAASIYSAGELEDDELRGQHDVETIFDTKKTEPRFPIHARKRAHAIAASSAIVQASTGHGDARTERKRFMSHKASVVAEGHAVNVEKNGKMFRNAADVADDGNLSRKEFRQMEREVLLYGATALDKKSRNAFEAARLAEMGARKQKGPRTPASIAVGMAKKRAQREAAALEEAINAGMVQRKGLGKKKRAEKKASLDRGLIEDNGAFRGGVLSLSRVGGVGRNKAAGFGKGRGRRKP